MILENSVQGAAMPFPQWFRTPTIFP